MENFEELLEQGETLAEKGLLEEALFRFEQAWALEPESPEATEAVGRALLGLDRTEEAKTHFLKAPKLDSEWVAPRMARHPRHA
jgi:Flp pilus assembly protein TadD